MKKEKIYHVKVPRTYWLTKFPNWSEVSEEERQSERNVLTFELQATLTAIIILTEYSEIYGADWWASKSGLYAKLLWAVRFLFRKHTPFGFHIIRIK